MFRSIWDGLASKNKKILLTLLGLDFLMLALHLTIGRYNHFFHLDLEQNLPTVYQSLKLIGFGIYFLIKLFQYKNIKLKKFFIPLTIFLIALGFDELLQIHENIYRVFELIEFLHPSKVVDASLEVGFQSSLWILYYLPIIFGFLIWMGYWICYFDIKIPASSTLIKMAIFFLFVILVAEVLSSTGNYDASTYFWMTTFEELAEMLFATTLVLLCAKNIDN